MRDLIQFTLTPEEATWLYAAANTAHVLAGAIGAEASGAMKEKAELMKLANKQCWEIFSAGECICPPDVLARLEKLIKNTTRAVTFSDGP